MKPLKRTIDTNAFYSQAKFYELVVTGWYKMQEQWDPNPWDSYEILCPEHVQNLRWIQRLQLDMICEYLKK